MLQLAWKNLAFRKMRTLLTILGVGSSIALVVLMSAIMAGTEKAFLDSFANMAGQIRLQVKSEALNGSSTDLLPKGLSLTQSAADEVMSKAKGYAPADSSPVLGYPLQPSMAPNTPDAMMLYGVLPGHENAALKDVALAEGESKLTGDYDVILGAGAHQLLSDKLGRPVVVGDTVTLPSVKGDFTVRGIAAKRDPYTDAAAVVKIHTAQQALGRGQDVTFVVLAYGVDQVEAAAEQLRAQFPDLDVITSDAMLDSVNKALTNQRAFFAMINGTVYFTAVAIIFMVMYTSVMERTREIGTMRAVGAPRGAVVGGILVEAVIFALAGAVGATLGAYTVNIAWGMLSLPEYLLQALQVAGGALVCALLSSLYPALRAARINPLEALRYE